MRCRGTPRRPRRTIRAAIAADPKSLPSREALMQLLMRRTQWDAAIQAGQEALAVEAKAASIHNLLGAAYLGKKDSAKAEQAFRKALEVDAKSTAALLSLGRLAAQDKKLDEAERSTSAPPATRPRRT